MHAHNGTNSPSSRGDISSSDHATSAPPISAELHRVFWSASYVLSAAKGLRRGERALAGRVVVQTFMRQEMPPAADVAAIDEACDRVLARMKSQLASFLRAERAARRARDGGRL
jgi:hypothetical protein